MGILPPQKAYDCKKPRVWPIHPPAASRINARIKYMPNSLLARQNYKAPRLTLCAWKHTFEFQQFFPDKCVDALHKIHKRKKECSVKSVDIYIYNHCQKYFNRMVVWREKIHANLEIKARQFRCRISVVWNSMQIISNNGFCSFTMNLTRQRSGFAMQSNSGGLFNTVYEP